LRKEANKLNRDMKLKIVPVFQREAFAFISAYHRHHKKPVGSIFQIAVTDGKQMVGVAVVGRPVARKLQDGATVEVTRLCTDGTQNACSILYAACWRITREMGYDRLITYILESEKGVSLTASGWRYVGKRGGGSWSVPSRRREDNHPLERKQLYMQGLNFELTNKEYQ
jgi:hypothetical protein